MAAEDVEKAAGAWWLMACVIRAAAVACHAASIERLEPAGSTTVTSELRQGEDEGGGEDEGRGEGEGGGEGEVGRERVEARARVNVRAQRDGGAEVGVGCEEEKGWGVRGGFVVRMLSTGRRVRCKAMGGHVGAGGQCAGGRVRRRQGIGSEE